MTREGVGTDSKIVDIGGGASLLAFTMPDQFKLLSGGDGLVDYQFNKHVIHYLFCPRCGIESFARGRRPDGKEMIAIDVLPPSMSARCRPRRSDGAGRRRL